MSKTEQIEVADEVVDADPHEVLHKQANRDWNAPVGSEKQYKLTIHRPKDEKGDDCFVSVNFKAYQIRYDEEVTVPKSVVDALHATKVTTMVQDADSKRMRPVVAPRFAFSSEAV